MLLEELREIVARQLDVDGEKVTPGARIIDDLKADSLDLVELVMDIEQTFDVEIPDEDFGKFATVAELITYIEKKIEKKKAANA